ncbi:MAG: adenine phosphoribosyltransferase [Thermoguttaceae bacterium]
MNSLENYIRSIPDFPIQGIIFRDITPLLEDAAGLQDTVTQMVASVKSWGKIDVVAAPEARGFIFAVPLALALGAGFVPIRKPGKLPFRTVSKSYTLEYGTNIVQMHEDAIRPGARVLLVDDLLATGGTMEACRELITENGGNVVGAAFLMELAGLNGRQVLKTDNVSCLITYPGA